MNVLTIGHSNDAVTTVRLPSKWTLVEAFQTITLPGGVGDNHLDDTPVWVSCPDSPGLAALLAEHYGCEVR